MTLDPEALDRWIVGANRYERENLLVTCPACGEETDVRAETEYGTTTWTPDECSLCGEPFPDDAEWQVL